MGFRVEESGLKSKALNPRPWAPFGFRVLESEFAFQVSVQGYLNYNPPPPPLGPYSRPMPGVVGEF